MKKAEQNYFNITIPKVLSGTKGKILKQINKQKLPTITTIAEKLNDITPNIAFHINGNAKTPDGLVQLGMVEKVKHEKGFNVLYLTKFGEKALEKLK